MGTINLPTFLTLLRLIVFPLILPLFIVFLFSSFSFWSHAFLVLLFTFASATDFLDGYLARKYDQVTRLGRFLDPLADKFLLYTTLIALVWVRRIFYYWALILIGREFFVMGLRIAALENGFSVPVDRWGKLKTAVITLYLVLVLAYCPGDHSGALFLVLLEAFLLGASLILSCGSGYSYFLSFVRQYRAV